MRQMDGGRTTQNHGTRQERVARMIDVLLARKRSNVPNCVGRRRDSWRLRKPTWFRRLLARLLGRRIAGELGTIPVLCAVWWNGWLCKHGQIGPVAGKHSEHECADYEHSRFGI